MTFSINNLEGGCNNPLLENVFGKNPQENNGLKIKIAKSVDKAKENKCYVSKLVTNWKTWPKRVFFFFTFFFFFFFPEQQTCQIWVGHSFEIWNLIFGWARYTRQNTELKKSVVQSVSLCFSYLFLYILTRKFIKNWKKKLSKQKNFKPWILLNQTRTEKQMRTAALRHMIYFF